MDLEHPTVTQIRRTGLPSMKRRIKIIQCSQCFRDLNGKRVIDHENGFFCDDQCLGEHLVENEEYEEVVL